jgi:hypothetical protein
MPRNFAWIPDLISMNTTGDFGPLTIYRSKGGRHIAYARTPATKKPSLKQRLHRLQMAQIAVIWNVIGLIQQGLWMIAAIKMKMSITGYNLFFYFHRTRDITLILKVELCTGIILDKRLAA